MSPVDMPAPLVALLGAGLVGIGGIAFVEKLVPAIPSYVLYVFLGMTAIADPSALGLTILATSVGSALGALCWYLLGRALGPQRTEMAVARFGRWVHLDVARYRWLGEAYRRRPFLISLFGQITPVVRLYAPLPAGMLGLKPIVFLAAALVGACVWNGLLLGFGYALRHGTHDPLRVGLAVIIGMLVLELAAILVLQLRRRAA
jgi:alkaline phosphatase